MSAEQINSKFSDGMINRIRQLSGKKKIALIVLAAFSVAVCIMLMQYIRVSGYRLLYTDLSYRDSTAVASWLNERNIGFQAKNNGRDIYIEADQIHGARLDISRSQQFEPADSLMIVSENGLHSFLPGSYQNNLTAIQSELAHTIAALGTVESARVIIDSGNTADALPQSGKPHASIFIEPASGKSVSAKDLITIAQLVSQSVAGLYPDSVDIYDPHGRVLSPGTYEPQNQRYPSSILSDQHSLENRLEQRAAEVADALIGRGRSLIKVSVTLDNSQSEATAEHYDPDDTTVKKEHTEFAPGSRYTAPDQPGQIQYIPPIPTTSSIDYELNKTLRTTFKPAGSIERVSVSILVSGKRQTAGDGTITTVPHTEEELYSLEKAVSSVIPIVADRGDTITVIPIPLHDSDIDLTNYEPSQTLYFLYSDLVISVAKIIMLILGFLLLYTLIIKPILHVLTAENDDDKISEQPTETDHDKAMDHDKNNENLTLDLKNEILRNPAPTVHIIKNWLQDT